MKSLILLTSLCIILWGCAATAPQPAQTPDKKPTVAIWDLENLSPTGTSQPDLGNMLSAKVIETFQQGGYPTIEREKLELALKELNLGSSSLADSSTRLRIGKIAGAKRMVFGAYQFISNQMRLDLRMVDVETGRIVKTAEKTTAAGGITGWLKAAEAAASELSSN